MKRFHTTYLGSFHEYISNPSELTLRAAYELGRDAVQAELSMLDLAIAHHEALASELQGRRDGDDGERIARAAGDFFLESISAFEMVQRGFREARDTAMLERRHAEMLRQLSHFLADASLSLDASDSLHEMLRLVAEQARELITAECCLVTTGDEDESRMRASSHPEDDLRWVAFARWVDLSQVSGLIRLTCLPARLGAGEIATLVRVPGHGPAGALELRSWLVAPLTALDGSVIGSIHLLTERDAAFSGLDEAVLQHLAQMSAAAIERSRMYSG
jgi:hypothetical protein